MLLQDTKYGQINNKTFKQHIKMQRPILSKASRIKIQARYNTKYEEFIKQTPEELKELYNSKKLSATDKQALIEATGYLLYKRDKDTIKDLEDTKLEETNDGN